RISRLYADKSDNRKGLRDRLDLGHPVEEPCRDEREQEGEQPRARDQCHKRGHQEQRPGGEIAWSWVVLVHGHAPTRGDSDYSPSRDRRAASLPSLTLRGLHLTPQARGLSLCLGQPRLVLTERLG